MRVGRDNSSIADGYARHDGDVATDPYIVSDNDISSRARMADDFFTTQLVLVNVPERESRYPIMPVIPT